MDEWEKAVQLKFGVGPEHLNISKSVWIWELWNKKEFPELEKNDNNLMSKLDKLHIEFAESSKKNEGALSQEFISTQYRFIAKREGPNILVLGGMNEMAKRSTAETSSTNTNHAIGTGTTTETVNDTALETEVATKAIGTRNTVNQTERYSTAFSSADLSSPPEDISEAGIFIGGFGTTMIMRITATPVELDVGKILTIQTNVTHQNGTEV